MALRNSGPDREYDKFVQTSDSKTAVRVQQATNSTVISTPDPEYSFTIGGQKTIAMSIFHNVDIGDISAGTQSNDVKITLDGEEVTVNATDLDIRNLTAATDSVKTASPALTNDGAKDTDYKVTVTLNTAIKVPETANVPAYDYVLLLGNTSDTAMVHGNSTAIIVGGAIDKGIPLAATTGAVSIKLKANEFLYVACSASKQLNYTIYSVEEAT